MTKRSQSITIRDVARQAGVSVATVSRYINRNSTVSDEVAQRIRKVMEELDYVPQTAARNLATRKTRTAGILLNNVSFAFFAPLLSGLEEILRESGYNLLVATYHEDLRARFAPPIGPHNADGVVVFANTLEDERLIHWHDIHFPTVLIYRTSPSSLSIPCVTVENKLAAYKVVTHLIEAHGRRRILYIRAPDNSEDTRRRETSYREALEAHSIAYDPWLVLGGGYEREKAYEHVVDFLSNNPPQFDAVFASDDELALIVMSALRSAGQKVPEDVAVVGFDDQRFASLSVPPLTTVNASTREVGRVAGQQLIKLLQGQPTEPMTIMPTDIVIRQSCGCTMPKIQV